MKAKGQRRAIYFIILEKELLLDSVDIERETLLLNMKIPCEISVLHKNA